MRMRSRILAVLLGAVVVVSGTAAPAHAAQITMKNAQTGLCLQPGGLAEFAPLVQRACDGTVTQGWQVQHVTGTRYKFRNVADGLCINEFDPLAIYARVLMVQCARVSNEEWQTRVTLPSSEADLESRSGNTDTQYCADAFFGEAILMTGCTGTPWQHWRVSIE